MAFPLIVSAEMAPAAHPLAGGIASLIGLLPLLPLVGALINGTVAVTARARAAGADATTAHHPIVSLVGPGVIVAAFGLSVAIFLASHSTSRGPNPCRSSMISDSA